MRPRSPPGWLSWTAPTTSPVMDFSCVTKITERRAGPRPGPRSSTRAKLVGGHRPLAGDEFWQRRDPRRRGRQDRRKGVAREALTDRPLQRVDVCAFCHQGAPPAPWTPLPSASGRARSRDYTWKQPTLTSSETMLRSAVRVLYLRMARVLFLAWGRNSSVCAHRTGRPSAATRSGGSGHWTAGTRLGRGGRRDVRSPAPRHVAAADYCPAQQDIPHRIVLSEHLARLDETRRSRSSPLPGTRRRSRSRWGTPWLGGELWAPNPREHDRPEDRSLHSGGSLAKGGALRKSRDLQLAGVIVRQTIWEELG